MSDLIDRQQAIDAIHEDADWLAAQGSDWQVERMERDKSILKSLPTVQPKGTKLSTVCLLCKKPAVTFNTEDDIPYTNYSYCEDCLRKGLKLLKKQIKALPPVQPTQTNCEYCHTDCDGYVFPLEKNCHAFIYRDKIALKANGWRGEAKIKYCPMCGRRLTDDH